MVSKRPTYRLGRDIELLKREKYGGSAQAQVFKKDSARLEAGEPLDYVIGWREFLGCKIDLSARPLIPREETEFWVGEVIKEILRSRTSRGSRSGFAKSNEAMCEATSGYARDDFSRPLRILDLFSGSGCIGLAVLKHIPNVHVTFAEKDSKLCDQIKKNLRLSKISPKRAKVVQTDLFRILRNPTSQSLQKSGKLDRFDLIFANPPYVSTKKFGSTSPTASRVQKSVKDWEPKSALYAGTDGLAIIKKFLKQAKEHLNPQGKIYLEFGYGQKAKIEKLLRVFDYPHYQFNKDQFGRYRWAVIEVSLEHFLL